MATSSVNLGRLPLGVAVLSVLVGLLGGFLLIAGLILLFVASVGLFTGLAWYGAGLFGSLLILILGAVLLAVAVGLWDQELWALVLSILVVGFLWLSSVLEGGLLTIAGLVLGLLLVYLVAVHRHFV